MKPSEIFFDKTISNRDKFGTYLKGRRIELGMSIRYFAHIINLTPAYISDIENGNRLAPVKYLDKIIEILDIEEDEIQYFYDLAGCSHENWPDINTYLARTPNARKALRLVRDKNIPAEELFKFVTEMANEQESSPTEELER